jgi:hypothetical protein
MRFSIAIITICALLYAMATWGTTGDTTVVGPTFSFGNISTSNLKVRSNRPSDRVIFVGANNATVEASGKTITFFSPVVGGVVGFQAYSSGVASRFRSTFLTQTANPNLPNSQAMGSLTTGLVKNTTTTGVQSIGVPGQDYVSGYAGLFAQPTITDNGDGSVTVAATTCMLYSNSDAAGGAKYYTVPQATLTPTDNASSVITISYNSGTPVYGVSLQSALLTNFYDVIPVVTLYRMGTIIDTLSWDATANGLSEKTLQRLVRTERFVRESGLALGEAATRYITITAGVTWNGVTRIELDAANSSTDPTTLWYHVAGVYTSAAITQYDNTQYDNGTALATLTNNRYAVNWVYRQEDQSAGIHVVLGSGDYSLPQAQNSQPPASLPEIIRTNSILVGRIIVEKSATTASQIDSSFNVLFTPTATTSHSDLTNLDYASASHTGFVGNTGNTAALDLGAYGVTAASLTDSGNLTFTGTGNRITGDMSNATLANRVAIQSSTTNGNTFLMAIPNGTSTASGISFYNTSDPANASNLKLFTSAEAMILQSTLTGTGATKPVQIRLGTHNYLTVNTTGNIIANDYTGTTVTETAGAEKLQVTGAISASGAVLVGGGANTVYYCDAGASVGNMCRGNGCSCVGGTWVATSLKID